MVDIGKILLHGAILAGLGSLLLMSAVAYNPRLARRGLPGEIKEKVPPLTTGERRRALFFAIPFFVLIIGGPFLSGLSLAIQAQGALSFPEIAVHVFGVGLVFNLVDLVLLDWLIYCTITPRFVVVPGTEGMAGYKDYLFHLRAHVRGTGLQVILTLVLVGLITLVA
ncbi:MAG: hypothetical protein AMS25_14210 [Gemmatimonas sp. SM23_52]|nr:MAG: hypothetical protein AMS25_14210 [Gemmatimonas sp. SM23_52]